MISSNGTFAPGDDSEELFSDTPDQPLTSRHSGCAVCSGELTRPLAKVGMTSFAHASCVHDAIETGLYSTAMVRDLEYYNKLPIFSLLKDHPTLNNCVLCGGKWGREEKVGQSLAIYAGTPGLSFAHKVCVSNAVHKRELSPARIASIANDSKLPVAALFPKSLQRCVYCSKAVDDKALLTHAGALAHPDCMTHLFQSGQLDEIQVADIISFNHIARKDLGESPRDRFNKKAVLGALVSEAQGFMAEMWNKFVRAIKGLFSKFEDVSSAYDKTIADLTSAISTVDGNATAASVIGGLRVEWVRDVNTHDVLIVSATKGKSMDFMSLADTLHRFLLVRPSKIVAAAGMDDKLDWREVLVPKTSARDHMLRILGIGPEVEQAMQFIAALENAGRENEQRINQIKQQFNIGSMDKESKAAQERILNYILTLTNKQRKFNDVMFRVRQATRKTTTSHKQFVDGLKAAYADNQAVTNKIEELLKAATTASSTYDALEVILPEIPSQVRQDLQEIAVSPAPEAAPAAPVPAAPAA